MKYDQPPKPRFRCWAWPPEIAGLVMVHPDGWAPSRESAVRDMRVAAGMAPCLPPIGKGLRRDAVVKDFKGNPMPERRTGR
jgi:hypothetical protein